MNRYITYDELTRKDKAGNDLFDKIGSVNTDTIRNFLISHNSFFFE